MNSSPQNTNSIGGQRRTTGIDNSDEEEWSGVVECAVLERTKSDRATRADEDRRRRTIIVEKKNGTYGFTLQSYGIHYKREQEIEMVTYVDYVEYDGPAFKAGMREGDVILSINGHEMDRADHKTLVNFIKNCDTRMRMVVSFEDCVRKVELHMRYIELQRALQSRLGELERLCERERSILMGRWKTHSLPARKRTPNSIAGIHPNQPSPSSSFNSSTIQCCRPATSTEHLLLYNVFADGRPYLIPRSAACLVTVGPPRSRSDHHHFLSKMSSESTMAVSSSRHSYHQANGMTGTPAKSKSHKQSCQPQSSVAGEGPSLHSVPQNNLCVACISSANRRREQSDSGSLDAYDLASPCCDPNCVPSPDSVASCSTSLSTDTLYWDPSVHQRPPPCLQYAKPKSWDNLTTKAFGGYGFGYGYLDTVTIKTHSAERPGKGSHSGGSRSKTPIGIVQRKSSGTSGSTVYSTATSSTITSRHFQPTKSTESLLIAPGPYQGDLDQASLSCECLDSGSGGGGPSSRFIQLDKHKHPDDAAGYIPPTHTQVRHRRSSHSDGKLRAINNSEVTRL
ncbi:General receptor for phosphoinositides 1-associated scaffold protein [Camponotus floridanus]|uniref:General receptor for phosphoinositides 1-associated scaffold protein n=1 Tax=Camponotus floridanus TaxID=104421 RepID=E2A7X6_CAMFO|nr:General receptor for phosphoinositides 1-associated scaffold protein [Camponotus floridanus]